MTFSEPMEAECKYRVDDFDRTRSLLDTINATFVRCEEHTDTYLRHPSRDFRATDEALRIREVNGEPFITYKGPKLSGPIKIRPEIELPLMPQTVGDWLLIWGHLGFVVALTVKKTRQVFQAQVNNRAATITLDQIDGLGPFVEIERIIHSTSEIEIAQGDIQQLALQLQLSQIEKRSYLGMLLELQKPNI